MICKWRNIVILIILLAASPGHAQNKLSPKEVEWHAYTQLRFATDFDSYNNFSVRRLKFWLKSAPGFPKHWSFKAQAIFMSIQKEKFFLQDVYGEYRWKNSSIRFGQFIPQYSLQRFQPDYLIPSSERARAVTLLIPNGTTGVRDIGVQYNLKAAKDKLQFNLGLFNGYGIKDYRFNNSGYLLTQNLSYRIPIKKSSLKFGYSVMYRRAENIVFHGILPDTVSYSGDDFRFNFYSIFTSKMVDVQAEYLQTILDTTTASGYYVLATVKFNPKNHAYFVFDEYTNQNGFPVNSPWYIAGYNYLFKKYKIMLSLESGFQKAGGQWQNRTVIQFQLFFH
ncbi:MAG: hypothetical protein DRI89_06905 [Bacteroidetes bacterium]|nr:MAG: hypothetical protein DRI89_06905 [Bacteroidota bacterium]